MSPQNRIKNFTGKTTKDCIKLLRKSYKKNGDYFELKNYSLLSEIVFIIGLSKSVFYSGKEVFTQEDLISQLIQSISKLSDLFSIPFNKKYIQSQSEDIVICIMCILHSRQFKLYDDSIGVCKMGVLYEKNCLNYTLNLFGSVEVKPQVNILSSIFKFKGNLYKYIDDLPVFSLDKPTEYNLTRFSAVRDDKGQLVIRN